jgi:hypothetical protein
MFSTAAIDFRYAQSTEVLPLLIPQLPAREIASQRSANCWQWGPVAGVCFELKSGDARRCDRSSAKGGRQRDAVDVSLAHAVS